MDPTNSGTEFLVSAHFCRVPHSWNRGAPRVSRPAPARRREARRTAQKLEADRVGAALAVTGAASAFIRAIRESLDVLAQYEAFGLDPARFLGPVWHDPPITEPIPGVDASGRALVVMKRASDGASGHWHERRTRGLARLVRPERLAFVEAVKKHPGAAEGAARKAREAFARAWKDARARHRVMMAGTHHG